MHEENGKAMKRSTGEVEENLTKKGKRNWHVDSRDRKE
jgi:hypothetical protein